MMQQKIDRRTSFGAAVIALVIGALTVMAWAGPPQDAKTQDTKSGKAKERTGEQLFAINCARCHDARYAPERTDAQWKTIVIHMRTRGRIPADDAKKILKYLQDNN
jgi:mono/diheme cytochrome c family protein